MVVNGKPVESRATTVVELLGELGFKGDWAGIAIALNGTVVRRGEWAETRIGEQDRVEIVGAVQGG